MTISTKHIDFSKVIGGNSRSVFKAAAVSLIALTAAMASARAQDTTISGDFTAYDRIYGNHGATYGTIYGSASDNNLTFEGSAATTNTNYVSIYGGFTDDATTGRDANGNTVNIAAFGNVGSVYIHGGLTMDGDAKENQINITAGTFRDNIDIYGGQTRASGAVAGDTLSAADNAVTITGGTFNGNHFEISGGYGHDGHNDNLILKVTGNSVTVSGGSLKGNDPSDSSVVLSGGIGILVGEGSSAAVTGNAVTVTNGDISGGENGVAIIIGGGARLENSNMSAKVSGNTVTVTGGTFADDASGTLEIFGGQINVQDALIADSSVADNTVKVTGGSFKGYNNIYGGYANNGAITVAGNKVYVSGGTFSEYTKIFGGYNYADGKVSGNKVYITGGTFNGAEIVGGDGHGGGEVSGNEVYLSGGAIAEDTHSPLGIIGGKAAGDGLVKNNTVYVSGDIDLSHAVLYAAYSSLEDMGKIKSGGGNTLVFGDKGKPWDSKNNSIDSVHSFDTVRITAATWDKPITVGYLDTSYAKNGKTEVDATRVAFAGVESVKKGDKTELLKAKEVTGDGLVLKSAKSTYTIGATLQGEGTVALDGVGTVTYEIDSARSQPQAHTAAMGMTAGVAAVNQGADTVLATLKNLSNSGHNGLEAFAAMGGGTARQETGSHVTLNAFNFATGLGSNIDVGAGLFTVGGALEAGYGSFKNHFDAGEADPFVKKSGHLHYYGAAATAGMKWNNLWHTDGLFRLGYAKSEQAGGLYNPGLGALYDVDIGSYYVGTEIGGGKAFKLDDANAIDVYARYFYLHKGGDDFTAGGSYDLKSVDSHRLRTGARYDLSLGNKWGFYAGLAYEYEFDGESRLFVDGVEAEAAKTKGGRAYGELGVKLTPEKDAAGLALDLNIKGAAGSKYRDVLFGVDVKYMF